MNVRNLTIQDPREFDGDPYQVAQRAIQQMSGLVAVTLEVWEPTNLMARNAELERQLALGNSLVNPAAEWPESPQGRMLVNVRADLDKAQYRLRALERAVAYNPKAR